MLMFLTHVDELQVLRCIAARAEQLVHLCNAYLSHLGHRPWRAAGTRHCRGIWLQALGVCLAGVVGTVPACLVQEEGRCLNAPVA